MQAAQKAPNPRRSACIRCTTAKAKCVLLPDQDVCERCGRLKRPCHFEDFTQPRKRKTSNSSRVEQLEAKVEALASALAAQKSSLNATPDSTEHVTPSDYSPRGSVAPQAAGTFTHNYEPELDEVYTNPIHRMSKPVDDDFIVDPVERGLLPLEEAEHLLQKFRIHKTPNFPFVIIPPYVTVDQLRHNCPFLFLSIMTVCVEDRLALQRAFLADVKRVVSRRIIEAEEKSLELLQGLIIVCCWFHYHVPACKQNFMLLQVAAAMVSDMGLDRPSTLTDVDQDHSGQLDAARRSRTSAETRAFLGLHFLYPGASTFRRNYLLKLTPWVMQCCILLEARREYPTDSKLRTYFQTLGLVLRVDEMCNREEEGHRGSDKILDMMIKMFHRELSDIKNDLPAFDATENYRFTLQLKALSVSIYELSLRKYKVEATTQSNFEPTQLWALMTSARDTLDYFLKLPQEICQHLPISSWTSVWYAFLLLTKLTTLPSGPSWDSALVTKEIDLDGIIKDSQRLLHETEQKRREPIPEHSEDIFLYFHAGVKRVIEMELVKARQSEEEESEGEDMSGTEEDRTDASESRITPAPIAPTYVPAPAGPDPRSQLMTYFNVPAPQQGMENPMMMMQAPTSLWDDPSWRNSMSEIPLPENSLLGNPFGWQFF